MSSNLVLQKKHGLVKKKYHLDTRDSWLIASHGDDVIRIKNLSADSHVVLYQEDSEWLIMAIGATLSINGEVKESSKLASGDEIQISGQKFVVTEASKPLKNQSAKKQGSNGVQKRVDSNPQKIRVILILCLIAAIILVVFVVNNVGDSSSQVEQSELYSTDIEEIGLSAGLKRTEGSSAEISDGQIEIEEDKLLNDSEAYDYYRKASNYYDLGYLQQAINTLQQGLALYPTDTILAKKLDSWQRNLSEELSRQFRDGCLHAKYFRNHEAKHSFAMVVEMSVNTDDVRYLEALRLLTDIKKNNSAKVQCGRQLHEN